MNNTCLNPNCTEVRGGISLVTAVKNRTPMLREVLATWMSHPEIDEIIIVDWDSEESSERLVNEFQDGRIFLAIVKEQPKWVLTSAFNLAARLSTREQLLKIDGDVRILPGFFATHPLQQGIFYTGNWRNARNENESHLNGNLLVSRSDFFDVNGYNEFFKTYGWDDTDLFERLEASGLMRLDFSPDTLFHMEHSDRTTNQDRSGFFPDISDEEWARHNILKNRYLATHSPQWSRTNHMMSFAVEKTGTNTFLCRQTGSDHNLFPSSLINEGIKVAIKDRLEEISTDFSVTNEPPGTLEDYISKFNQVFGRKKKL